MSWMWALCFDRDGDPISDPRKRAANQQSRLGVHTQVVTEYRLRNVSF